MSNLACEVQEDFNPLGKNTSIRPAQCTEVVQGGIVVDSSQARELDSRENIATVNPACGVREDFDELQERQGESRRWIEFR